jgi:hypothetical protein
MIISRELRWVGHVACMGQVRNVHKILIRIPEGKGPFRIPRCRWEDNIKVDIKGTAFDNMDCIHLAQWWALVNMVMNFQCSIRG